MDATLFQQTWYECVSHSEYFHVPDGEVVIFEKGKPDTIAVVPRRSVPELIFGGVCQACDEMLKYHEKEMTLKRTKL